MKNECSECCLLHWFTDNLPIIPMDINGIPTLNKLVLVQGNDPLNRVPMNKYCSVSSREVAEVLSPESIGEDMDWLRICGDPKDTSLR